MDQNTLLASGVTGVVGAVGYLLWRNGCKKRNPNNTSITRKQGVKRGQLDTNVFPDTAICSKFPVNKFADLRCGPKNDAKLASLLHKLLLDMKFKRVTLPNSNNKEKEFQFKLQGGNLITVLSAISTNEKKVLARKTVCHLISFSASLIVMFSLIVG